MYITMQEYINMGGVVTDNTTFTRLAVKAQREIDYQTFNRLQGQIIPDEVKQCMVELINRCFTNEDNITSINNDGVAISYGDKIQTNDSIIRKYLANTIINDKKILYRGVYADEHI